MNDVASRFLVVLGTITTLVFNWLATTGILGGVTTGAVSDSYQTEITPASMAFPFIWGLIYLGMIFFTVAQAVSAAAEFGRIRSLYLVTCATNCLWLYLWSQEMLVLCLLVIVIFLVALAVINIRLQDAQSKITYWFGNAPFGLYFGWVTAATILNATIALKSLGVDFGPETNSTVGALLLVTAGVIAVAVRFMMKNYFFALSIAWAGLMIAINNSPNRTVTIGASVAVVMALISAGLFVIDMKGYSEKGFDG